MANDMLRFNYKGEPVKPMRTDHSGMSDLIKSLRKGAIEYLTSEKELEILKSRLDSAEKLDVRYSDGYYCVRIEMGIEK